MGTYNNAAQIQNSIMSVRRKKIIAFLSQDTSKTGFKILEMVTHSTTFIKNLDYVLSLNEAINS